MKTKSNGATAQEVTTLVVHEDFNQHEPIQAIEKFDQQISKTPIFDLFRGASELVLTPEESDKLLAPVNEVNVQLRPDGLIYVPQVFTRERLNKSVGIGQWSLIEVEVKAEDIGDETKVFFVGALIIRKCFVSKAVGESTYHKTNPLESWATAYESAKSDALTRCAKDVGIFGELWDKNFVDAWIAKNAVKVWIEGKQRPQWRKKDAPPFFKERGLCDDSPNKPINTPAKKETPSQVTKTSDSAKSKTAKPVERGEIIDKKPIEDARLSISEVAGAFDLACEYVKTKGAKIATIERKYRLTDEQRSTLIDIQSSQS
jgi:hypothetical protein